MPMEQEEFNGTIGEAFERLADDIPVMQSKLSTIEQMLLKLKTNLNPAALTAVTIELQNFEGLAEAYNGNAKSVIHEVIQAMLKEVISNAIHQSGD